MHRPAWRASARLIRAPSNHHRLPFHFVSSPSNARKIVTLAIETSCDDTCVAVLEQIDSPLPGQPLLQVHHHERVTANSVQHGGIHPLVALDSHTAHLSSLIHNAITKLSTVQRNDDSASSCPDFVSVTRGPGMRANLNVGLQTAKGLALAWDVPLVGVHHMHAHALTPRLVAATQSSDVKPGFPFLTMLVSGGHSLLLQSTSLLDHSILAETIDIAAGDALDKMARVILPPDVLAALTSTAFAAALEKFAFPSGATDYETTYEPPARFRERYDAADRSWSFRAPLAVSKGNFKRYAMDYSFSGPCSAVERLLAQRPDMSLEERRELAVTAQMLVFEHLASRVILALQRAGDARMESLVVSGGVAANGFLRHVLRRILDSHGHTNIDLQFPPLHLCTDNAVMIGWAGLEMFNSARLHSELGIAALKKWTLDPDGEDGGILGVGGWMRRDDST